MNGSMYIWSGSDEDGYMNPNQIKNETEIPARPKTGTSEMPEEYPANTGDTHLFGENSSFNSAAYYI